MILPVVSHDRHQHIILHRSALTYLYSMLSGQYRTCMLLLFWLLMHSGAVRGQVFLIPTLHSLHQSNRAYSYDSLKVCLQRLHPDLVLVEIRDEDSKADSSYLAENYPLEMRSVKTWLPKVRVEGFDWLGADLEGREIPRGYWRDSSIIKLLQKKLSNDSNVQKQLGDCSIIDSMRFQLLASNSLRMILRGKDHQWVRDYYDCMEKAFAGTEYAALTRFYRLRNEKMLARLKVLLRQNKGKRVAILTGDDHYPWLYEGLLQAGFNLRQPVDE